jgi:tRNA U38,U39,U40 pseudouridine synthase TruA
LRVTSASRQSFFVPASSISKLKAIHKPPAVQTLHGYEYYKITCGVDQKNKGEWNMLQFSWEFLYLMIWTSFSISSSFVLNAITHQPFRFQLSKQHQCEYCTEIFESRNSLFRHLRNSDCGKGQDSFELTLASYELRRIDAALLLNYDAVRKLNDDSTNIDCREKVNDAEQIGNLVRNLFHSLLQSRYQHITGDIQGGEPCVISSTQSSVAKQRHFSLSQENGISSAGDVLMVSYLYPVKRTFKAESLNYQEESEQKDFQRLIEILNEQLSTEKDVLCSTLCGISNIEIATGVVLSRERKLHAEMDCTQRTYHYILPLSWLEGGNEIASWWLDNQKFFSNGGFNDNENSFRSRGEARAKQPPPNDILIRFKSALRSFESSKVLNWDDEYAALGRYGALALRKRTPFHNFANPKLMGDASPSNKPVWRVVDRCRIAEFISYPDKDGLTEVSLVVEVRADDVLVDQVRRMIGSSVAMANGWLPSDFTSAATDPTLFVQTPLSPLNRCYFAHSRFHFDELKTGTSLFEDNIRNECITTIQKRILSRANDDIVKQYEDSFLRELKERVCPRIHEDLKRNYNFHLSNLKFKGNIVYSMPSNIYEDSLSNLRYIVENGKWLATSTARSKVIKKTEEEEEKDPERITSGSFTIINPDFNDGSLLKDGKIRLPLGNQVFPELVKSIFLLESKISLEMGFDRPASSHCAVNRNAQFTPHVDSGRGLGQSKSMIVGLGDYTGGEIIVEGTPYAIRYEPLQFDGWKQRHWTAPFDGERFSLVWFTPEMQL